VSSRSHRAALAALLLAGAGCGAEFSPQFRVQDLRVIALRARVQGVPVPDQPGATYADVAPEQRLRLEALVANPGNAAFSMTWLACVPSRDEDESPCLRPEFLADPTQLEGQPGVRQLPVPDPRHPEVAVLDIPRQEDLPAPLVQEIAAAAADPSKVCTLFVELPVLAILQAGDVRRTAVKRIRVVPARLPAGAESAYERNVNPVMGEVLLRAGDGVSDDQPCTGARVIQACAAAADCGAGVACVDGICADGATPPRAAVLCASAARPPPPAQLYKECAADGTQRTARERLSFQWYASDGTFTGEDGLGDGNVTGRARQFQPPAGAYTMWVILRDDRGGEDWVMRQFR
jgi:hypothetical protein